MKISFDLTDDVVKQLKSILNLDKFVNLVIKKVLQNQLISNDKPSKWALLAQEIENNPSLNLDGYSKQLKKDSLGLRASFIFSSDQNCPCNIGLIQITLLPYTIQASYNI